MPVGWLDSIDANGNALGWSADPDRPQEPNQIHFYIDGPAGTGTYIGAVTTDFVWPGVPYPGPHGYRFSIPAQYRDGQQHTLYAYGIDLSGDHSKLLDGNPKTFNLSLNVASVTFEEIAPATSYSIPMGNNPLNDDDGGTDEGLRIFPDDDFPLEGAGRDKILVKARLNAPIAGKLIYFRNFDMDDPSVYSDVDPDSLGNDNNGSARGNTAGILSSRGTCQAITGGLACPTDSEGVAFAYFQVTMQPGDNFAIAASTSESEISSVGLHPSDGLHLSSTSAPTGVKSGPCAPSDKICRSRLLTVWRRVHIEMDRMPTVSGNFVEDRMIPAPPGQRGLFIFPGETKEVFTYNPLPEGSGFENGLFVLGVHRLSIAAATPFSFTVTNTGAQAVHITNQSIFRLYDDDDFNNTNGADLTGDDGEAIPPPDVSLIPEGSAGDHHLSNVLARAYIRPVYYNANTLGTGFAQQFKVNIDDFAVDQLEPIISFDNRATEQDPKFWTVYLLNAYQGEAGKIGILELRWRLMRYPKLAAPPRMDWYRFCSSSRADLRNAVIASRPLSAISQQ